MYIYIYIHTCYIPGPSQTNLITPLCGVEHDKERCPCHFPLSAPRPLRCNPWSTWDAMAPMSTCLVTIISGICQKDPCLILFEGQVSPIPSMFAFHLNSIPFSKAWELDKYHVLWQIPHISLRILQGYVYFDIIWQIDTNSTHFTQDFLGF